MSFWDWLIRADIRISLTEMADLLNQLTQEVSEMSQLLDALKTQIDAVKAGQDAEGMKLDSLVAAYKADHQALADAIQQLKDAGTDPAAIQAGIDELTEIQATQAAKIADIDAALAPPSA